MGAEADQNLGLKELLEALLGSWIEVEVDTGGEGLLLVPPGPSTS